MFIIQLLDILFFIISSITVLYLLFFSFAAFFKKNDAYHNTKARHRFAVLIPAYKDDDYIIPTVRSVMRQDYPIDCYEIVVIADHLHPDTILSLSQLPITLVQANFIKSSKTKALKAATSILNENNYDIAVILNADNLVDTDYLIKINETFEAGSIAIQSHRVRQERSTNISVIDAVADEINNTITRLGHVALGLSSSLNGSGMAFDYSWFNENINKLSDEEDEKALESLLLKDRIFIDYLDDANIYATKIGGKNKFYTQRRNWIHSHYSSFFGNIKNLPSAIVSGNFDYADRIIQWGIFPRSIMFIITIFFSTILLFIEWSLSIKWFILFILLLFSMALATPDYLVDNKFNKSMKAIPIIALSALINLLFKKRNHYD
ncbi:glycosyltransferase family 2 protein [Phocaeicola paurosaccharolyticus]|uniref:glycosyltransferase family 2 protein n=1 Tax=Phocaeicola paurosaccharolyticus TaxID=732242 RepID=UPI0004682F17|nr:glycosyltransferase family 2 protein [Phocaeicola paurosaccharolyticus]